MALVAKIATVDQKDSFCYNIGIVNKQPKEQQMAGHKDMQGKTLKVGDTVAYVSYHNGNSLVIGRVRDLKKVRAEVVTSSSGWLGGDTVETIRSDQLIKLAATKAPKSRSAKILAFPSRA